MLIIDDDLQDDDILYPKDTHRGYDPDYITGKEEGMRAAPSEMELIPRSEWSDRIKEGNEQRSFISHKLRAQNIPSTDQNGHGYCWAYSMGGCVIAARAVANQPYVPLNPHSVAAVIKRGRDEGGWCGLSAQFIKENGIAPASMWPKNSRDYRRYYTEACKQEMKKYRTDEDWVDLDRHVASRNLTFDQLATCLLSRRPCAVDFNWWGHSVLACDLVEVERDSFGILIRNSWTDGWGDLGFAVLRGNKARPNGAVSIGSVYVTV